MKTNKGASIIAVFLAALVIGTTGCQSGWKFSNPFSRNPNASKAGGPSELDELDALNDITPPPENYTSNDSTTKSEKNSLAQKGKYEANDESIKEAKETKVALNNENAEPEKPSENFATPSYSQNYQASNPLAAGVGSTADYASAQESPMDQFANANAAPATNPALQQGATGANQALPNAYANTPTTPNPYPAPDAPSLENSAFPTLDVASTPSPFPTMDAVDTSVARQNYPTQDYAQPNQFLQNQAPQNQFAQSQPQSDPLTTPAPYNPIAQVSGSSATYQNPNANQAPVPAQQAPNLAYNYDAQNVGAPVANPTPTPTLDSNVDPYSNVIYEPQNVSGGFAPGSVLY